LLAGLANLGANLTFRQKQYLKWRTSKRGRRYFTAEEENAFYEALERGDVDVIDVGIHEKQKRIRELRRKLGLLVLWAVGMMLIAAGCKTVPTQVAPTTTVAALTEEERSYVVEGMHVKVDGKPKLLEG